MKKIIADVPEKKRSDDIDPNHLFHEGKKFTKKVMISAVASWNGVSKPLFLG